MRKFDTQVQHLKYKVLREVARHAYEDTLLESISDIPKEVMPLTTPAMRCCIYKEQAILAERVKLAMGGNKKNPNVIETIEIACDECPVSGYEVTGNCRGCIAHRCEAACPKDAIYFDHHKAHIDKTKCVECGRCASVCPYSAISNHKRPCENACKVKAISRSETMAAKIDNEKCIACGACVYQCPFGAIMDKSYILDAINLIKNSEGNTKYKVYAVVAPSISSQFSYAKLGQVVTGIKELGFYHVVEAALGADIVSSEESKELLEKGFLTNSCCPAFVSYVEKQFSDLAQHVSHNPSPMVAIGKHIKRNSPGAKVVFIGPCTAKKTENTRGEAAEVIDVVLTFEELQALFDGKRVDLPSLPETVLDNASYFGRIFARSGGLSESVGQALKEQDVQDLEYKPVVCDGIEECKVALLKARKGILDGNFIEGMACTGGCIGGAGCLTHGPKNRADVDKYGKQALEKTIKDAISVLKI